MRGMMKATATWVAATTLAATAGTMALRGDVSDAPTAWLSPPGAVEGKTVDLGEALEMTLHVEGAPQTAYAFTLVYGGAAKCATEPSGLTTNPEGKATWTCDYDTSAPGDGTVTFEVRSEGGEVLESLTAGVTVREAEPAEAGEEPAGEASEEKADNHGQCVRYWNQRSKSEGLSGRRHGAFVSMVARSDCAGAQDPEEFAEELAAALEAQEEALAEREAAKAGRREGKGKPSGEDDSHEEEGSES